MPTRFAVCALVSLASCLLPPPARADLVIMKDGYALHGKVRRQVTTVFEPGVGLVEIARVNSFFMVDDECRNVIFSFRQVQDVDEKDLNRDSGMVRVMREVRNIDAWKFPQPCIFVSVTPFDTRWERTFTLQTAEGPRKIDQRLGILTPHFARVESLRYRWAPCYLTREFDPGTVRALLLQHPDLKATGTDKDGERRLIIFRFLLQAGWYDLAERELDEIAKEFSDLKDKIEAGRGSLRKLRAMRFVDDLELAQKAGRHQTARQALATYSPEGLTDESLLSRLQALRAQYEAIHARLAPTRQQLQNLPARFEASPERDLLSQATWTILGELNEENVGRLEAFLPLAQQAERAQQLKQTPDHKPEQLAALAITGWLLGAGSAEAKVETAVRLWRARQLILEYQNTHRPDARKPLAEALQKSGLAFDELAQVIRYAPPPEPWPVFAARWPAVAGCWLQGFGVAAGQWPRALAALPFAEVHLPDRAGQGTLTIKMNTSGLPSSLAQGRRRGGIPYWLQLPPEYHHGRSWPLLIALHQAGESPELMMRRFGPLAAQHGYLLVAPEWGTGFQEAYGYQPEEHAAVLDTLRDLRRRFQVDSDRVFLTGWCEGGNMAYDVGLSHPDLFAGVLPVCGRPRYHARAYWRNAQHLPLYVTEGGQDGDGPKDNLNLFEQWVPRGYPALYVGYKARGPEWFAGEVPYLFDWMSRKKRSTAFPELGRTGGVGVLNEEYQSLRPTDDRFYWLSVDGIHDRNTAEAGRWRSGVSGATLAGRVSAGNHINLYAHGFRKVTLWLGQGMIDFDKNATVYVNGQARLANRKVVPNLTTLLEDFYQRGDRQRLFWAKVEFPL
jgi:dienelactone hydrolase